MVHEVSLPNGEDVSAIGLGTWRYGESSSRRETEVSALRLAFEIGYRVVDTAEMYAAGQAESVVGEAVAGAVRHDLAREDLFIVSKVLPENADPARMVPACEASLRRLRIDTIDLYLLHWRGSVPLKDTVDGFEILQRRGWIRHWGVSNFDLHDMRELHALPGGAACAANQVYLSLGERGPEFELLPWLRLHQQPLMAYSPLDQGELAPNAVLDEIGERHGATGAQVALAWLLTLPGVMPIPKAVRGVHLQQNWDAMRLKLRSEDLARLELAFPRPSKRRPLAMR